MEYQEFKMMIKERLQKMIGDSVEVTIEIYYFKKGSSLLQRAEKSFEVKVKNYWRRSG